MAGPLLKLTIIPFSEDKSGAIGQLDGAPFIVQFNPETYKDTTTFKFDKDLQPIGSVGSAAKFQGIEPKEYSFDLLLDGTGVSPAPPPLGQLGVPAPSTGESVTAQIELFRLTVGFRGDIHRPRFLMLLWGRLTATTVLKTFSVNYTLFSPQGLPLRATLSATFREHTEQVLGELLKNLGSPDVDHACPVMVGDNLTTLVDRVYKDPAYYMAVAEANQLNTVRALRPGSTLHFPPVR